MDRGRACARGQRMRSTAKQRGGGGSCIVLSQLPADFAQCQCWHGFEGMRARAGEGGISGENETDNSAPPSSFLRCCIRAHHTHRGIEAAHQLARSSAPRFPLSSPHLTNSMKRKMPADRQSRPRRPPRPKEIRKRLSVKKRRGEDRSSSGESIVSREYSYSWRAIGKVNKRREECLEAELAQWRLTETSLALLLPTPLSRPCLFSSREGKMTYAAETEQDAELAREKSIYFRKKWKAAYHKVRSVLRMMKAFKSSGNGEGMGISPLQQASQVIERRPHPRQRRRTSIHRTNFLENGTEDAAKGEDGEGADGEPAVGEYLPVMQPNRGKQTVGFEFKNAVTREMKDEAVRIVKKPQGEVGGD